jgi:hypothetical protein
MIYTVLIMVYSGEPWDFVMEGFFVDDLPVGSNVHVTIRDNGNEIEGNRTTTNATLLDVSVNFCDFGMKIWQNGKHACPPRKGDAGFTRREIVPYFVDDVSRSPLKIPVW